MNKIIEVECCGRKVYINTENHTAVFYDSPTELHEVEYHHSKLHIDKDNIYIHFHNTRNPEGIFHSEAYKEIKLLNVNSSEWYDYIENKLQREKEPYSLDSNSIV